MKKSLIILFAAGLLTLLFFFSWRFFKQPSTVLPSSGPEKATTKPSDSSQNTDSDSDEETPIVDRETYIKKRFQDRDRMIKDANVPVEFYGKVIDQTGAPVPGVKVKLTILSYDESVISDPQRWIDQIRTKKELSTSNNGLFSFSGSKGYSLTVESLEREGYESPSRFGLAKDFQYSGNLSGIKLHSPDPNNPTIFKMWKKVGPQPLLHYEKDTRIPYDGTPVVFDLTRGRKVTDEKAADIRVRLLRTPLQIKRGQQKYDWTAQIDSIDGGLIQSNDEFMNLAPESGYEKGVEIQMLASDPEWRSDVSVALYLKSRGGKNYGRLKLEFRTGSDQPTTGFSYDAYINPAGSRNLEYDVNKKINAQ